MPQRHHAALVLLIALLISVSVVFARQPAATPTPGSNDPITRIREEGLKHWCFSAYERDCGSGSWYGDASAIARRNRTEPLRVHLR